jgi:predicted O-methyltransferase YrrM
MDMFMQFNRFEWNRRAWNLYYSLHPKGLLNILQKMREGIAGPPLGIPEIDFGSLLKELVIDNQNLSQTFIHINPFPQGIGSISIPDRISLATLAAYFKSIQNILEIGTFNGETARILAMNSPNAKIFTIDLPIDCDQGIMNTMTESNVTTIMKRSIGTAYKNTPEEARIIQLFGDSRNFNFKENCPIFDMIFIDGCHDYEYVKSDTLQALDITRHGGLIIWHDCTTSFPDVIRVVKSFVNKGAKRIRDTQIAFMVNQ